MTEPIQVAIVRTVKPGSEAAFEKALHEFVQRTLPLSGQMGVHIIRPAPGSNSRQYGIIRKFADREAVSAFRTSAEYLAWNHEVMDFTEGSARAEEYCGLESWFTAPGENLRPLPKWKMSLVTYLGVVPVIMGLSLTVGTWMGGWDFVLRNLVFNALVVILLTWVVMPLITRIFHRWLHSR